MCNVYKYIRGPDNFFSKCINLQILLLKKFVLQYFKHTGRKLMWFFVLSFTLKETKKTGRTLP